MNNNFEKTTRHLMSFGLTLVVAVLTAAPAAQAANGDVSYAIDHNQNNNVYVIPDGFSGGLGTNMTLDVKLQLEGGGSVTAGGFAVSLKSLGPIRFNPTPGDPNNPQPNLPAATENAFLFDTTSTSGAAYGNLVNGSDSELGAVAITTGAELNLTVPHNAGLFAAPINIPDGTTGIQTIEFGDNPNADSLFFVGATEGGDYYLPIGTSNDAKLNVIETVPGDADLSGVVDLADLGLFLNNLGNESAGWQQANFSSNVDNVVDLLDLGIFLENLGNTAVSPSASASAALPEPSTLAMLFMASCFALLRRRRWRS